MRSRHAVRAAGRRSCPAAAERLDARVVGVDADVVDHVVAWVPEPERDRPVCGVHRPVEAEVRAAHRPHRDHRPAPELAPQRELPPRRPDRVRVPVAVGLMAEADHRSAESRGHQVARERLGVADVAAARAGGAPVRMVHRGGEEVLRDDQGAPGAGGRGPLAPVEVRVGMVREPRVLPTGPAGRGVVVDERAVERRPTIRSNFWKMLMWWKAYAQTVFELPRGVVGLAWATPPVSRAAAMRRA